MGPELLQQALLEWSAQSVLRALPSGDLERLVDANFLGIDPESFATQQFLNTLSTTHRESVLRLAAETSKTRS